MRKIEIFRKRYFFLISQNIFHPFFIPFPHPWHEANGNCFHHSDAVEVLAYAVIMLNTDQHNDNVAKNAIPMTVKNFKNNVRGCNGPGGGGGVDFDQEMLEKIFENIRDQEIVLPEEQKGRVEKFGNVWRKCRFFFTKISIFEQR